MKEGDGVKTGKINMVEIEKKKARLRRHANYLTPVRIR